MVPFHRTWHGLDEATCLCGEGDGTPDHIVFSCRKTQIQRRGSLDVLREERIDIPYNLKALLQSVSIKAHQALFDFLKEAGQQW